MDRGRRALSARRFRSAAWWFQREHLQCTLVTPSLHTWSASNDPRPCGSVKCSAPALIRLMDDPCAIIRWKNLARDLLYFNLPFSICKLKHVSMANGSSLRRQRREVGFSWLGHPNIETCFALPQRGHVFPRNKTSTDPFAYKSISIGNLTYSEVTHTSRRPLSNSDFGLSRSSLFRMGKIGGGARCGGVENRHPRTDHFPFRPDIRTTSYNSRISSPFDGSQFPTRNSFHYLVRVLVQQKRHRIFSVRGRVSL